MRFLSAAATIALLAMGALASAPAMAAQTNGTATATIITPISISPVNDLAFGNISAGTGGSVTIAVDGTQTSSGGVTVLSGSTASAGSFSVAGQANATYTITLPASVSITDAASNTMTVDTFTSNPNGTGTLDATGAQTLSVGATLTVNPSQPAGSYSGPFTVTVNYN